MTYLSRLPVLRNLRYIDIPAQLIYSEEELRSALPSLQGITLVVYNESCNTAQRQNIYDAGLFIF
jgi:hypothetical protein